MLKNIDKGDKVKLVVHFDGNEQMFDKYYQCKANKRHEAKKNFLRMPSKFIKDKIQIRLRECNCKKLQGKGYRDRIFRPVKYNKKRT
jgi:hypothetical protein